jgi:hypothetical protein
MVFGEPEQMTKKPVLVARIAGGLGNQMFTYAAARRLAHINQLELALDMKNGFSRDGYGRFYQLDCFTLNARRAKPRECLQPFNRIRRKYLTRKHYDTPFSQAPFIKQKGVAFNAEILDTKVTRNCYFEGNWQGEKYFSDIADIIRDDFTLALTPDTANAALLRDIQQQETPVALHVRFFAPPGVEKNDNASLAYYRNAMAALEAKIANPHYYVFSDRPQDAIDMLGLDSGRFTLVTHNNTAEAAPFDIWLMQHCRHFIIANSTFSWWGAWLGTSADKLVFAPELTNDVVGKYASWGFDGLLPDSWHQI